MIGDVVEIVGSIARISNKTKTSIEGLDVMLMDGIPKGSTVLVSGKIGTGKTIMGLQYLYNGVVDYGETGIYVAVDERPEDLRKEAMDFGWDLEWLERENKIIIVDVWSLIAELPSTEKYFISGEINVDNIVSTVIGLVNSIGAKRLVFDSIPALAMQMNVDVIRKTLHRLCSLLLSLDCTSLLLTEIDEATSNISKFNIEEFLTRGVIVLDYKEMSKGTFIRAVQVRKMRNVNHDLNWRPFEITSEGLVVHSYDSVF